VIGGCDGAEANRTYFRDIALGLPNDAVVLTLGA
jgi:hydroxylamine reductase (hybrid-cluster protein)